jgi:hypothetical protein
VLEKVMSITPEQEAFKAARHKSVIDAYIACAIELTTEITPATHAHVRKTERIMKLWQDIRASAERLTKIITLGHVNQDDLINDADVRNQIMRVQLDELKTLLGISPSLNNKRRRTTEDASPKPESRVDPPEEVQSSDNTTS